MGLYGHTASHKVGKSVGRCKLKSGPRRKKQCSFSGAFEEMRDHLESVHGVQGAHSCRFCHYESNWKKLFDTHMSKVHFKPVRMECKFAHCSFTADGIAEYRSHVAETHGNYQSGYRCHLCEWTSLRKESSAELISHLDEHHGPEEEEEEEKVGKSPSPPAEEIKYPTTICGYCGKEVLRKNYTEHIKVHRMPESRRFFCHLCRDQGSHIDFVKGITLRNHLREVHGIDYIMMNETLSQCALTSREDNLDVKQQAVDSDDDAHDPAEDANSFQEAMLANDDSRDSSSSSNSSSSNSSSSSTTSGDSSRRKKSSSSSGSSSSDSDSSSNSSSSSSSSSKASSNTTLPHPEAGKMKADVAIQRKKSASPRGPLTKHHEDKKIKTKPAHSAMTEVGCKKENDSICYDVIRRIDGVTAHSRHCESARRGTAAAWQQPPTVAAADDTFHTVAECPVTRAVDEAIASMRFASDQMVRVSVDPSPPRDGRPCPYVAALDHVHENVEKSLKLLNVRKA